MTFPEAGKWIIALCLALLSATPAFAQEDEAQAWLLTYGPGEIYWQRFGHNAIWIRDPELRIDHTFNFGFFDFTQENFLTNFVKGRLNYFAAARPAQVELGEYITEDRSIRAQRLDLDLDQFARLRDYLVNEVSAQNREYLYDYYLHNCSTRVRDALDLVLDGAMKADLDNQPARLDFRDQTRRLTDMDFWYYLGLQAGLGSPVDQAVSRWDELFIPGELAGAVEGMVNPRTGGLLVTEEAVLHQSALPPPGQDVRAVWYRYALVAALALVLAWGLCRVPGITAKRLALTWYSISGLLGAVLFFLWLFTDHWVSALNLNVLLLNPLWLLVAIVPLLRKPGAWLVVVAGLMALVMPWLPPWQYTLDVVALVLPLNLAASLVLLRSVPQLGQ